MSLLFPFLIDLKLISLHKTSGKIHSERLNTRRKDPVSQPVSVIMDVATYPKKWETEWYTTWHTRKYNPDKGDSKKENSKKRSKRSKKMKKKSKRSRRHDAEEPEEKLEKLQTPEIPEIGKIYSLRFRGESASRVHLGFISYLSESRWKQKYFPKGIFTHD